jgi:hypothetical protein
MKGLQPLLFCHYSGRVSGSLNVAVSLQGTDKDNKDLFAPRERRLNYSLCSIVADATRTISSTLVACPEGHGYIQLAAHAAEIDEQSLCFSSGS